MPFQLFDLSLQLVALLRQPLAAIAQRDPDLASQLRRAASSVPLNVAEGNERHGRDRLHHFRVAAGSAAETVAALRVAVAWGYLGSAALAPVVETADRVRAILWRLTHAAPATGAP